MFVNGDGQGLTSDTTARAAQISPGTYNETVLKRFDSIIWMAGEAMHYTMIIIHDIESGSGLTTRCLSAVKSAFVEGLGSISVPTPPPPPPTSSEGCAYCLMFCQQPIKTLQVPVC